MATNKELQTTEHTRIAWSEYLHFPHNEIKVLYKVTCNIKKTHLTIKWRNEQAGEEHDSSKTSDIRHWNTYIRDQAHGFHLIRKEESVLQASSFHGANDEGVEYVSGWLYSIQHHIIVHIPQQVMPIPPQPQPKKHINYYYFSKK